MTSEEQPDVRTEGAEPVHLPVRATASQVIPLFDTSCLGLTDHRGAGPTDKMPSGPGLQKAGSYGSNQVEQRRQVAEGAAIRDTICSTATARVREQGLGEHGPIMQVRSQQTCWNMGRASRTHTE